MRFTIIPLLLSLAIISGCKKDNSTPLPQIVTGEATNITSSSVDITCNLISAGADSIMFRGIVIGKTPNPEPTHFYYTYQSPGNGTGMYTGNFTMLDAGTTYHARALIQTHRSTYYGDDITFTTSGYIGISKTLPPTNIQINSARFRGNDSTAPGGQMFARGFIYSDHPFQDSFGTYANVSFTGVGDYSYDITGLQPNTTYYVRSYYAAGNEMIVGDELSFKTTGYNGPAGGYVFYDKGEVTNGWRYMEAGPADINVGGTSHFAWGCTGLSIPTTEQIYGTGLENTNKIIAGCSSGSAAMVCHNYSSGGFIDWHLPSSDELYIMFTCLKAKNAVAPGINYWSSTELDASFARCLNTNQGQWGFCYKDSLFSIRAIRRY